MGRPLAQETLKPVLDFSCSDWIERLKIGKSLVPDLPINIDEGNRAVEIFNRLRLPDVPGQPTLGDAGGDWFRNIIRPAFGSLDIDTGIRHISEVFLCVPKKNSKTTNSAALMITALLMNFRPNAEMLFIGPTQDIADVAFSQSAGMILCDTYLTNRFHIADHKKTIIDRVNNTRLKIKTFDKRVLTGSKPVIVLIDELHILAAYSYAASVIGQIRGGLLPNPESLLIFITTQSDIPPTGVFKEELEYARGVRDGRITRNVRMLPVIYELPEELQTAGDKPWRNPELWPMVLPNLGRSITIDRLIDSYEMARQKGEIEERRWASQHLNVQIGIGSYGESWRGADYWLKQADQTITFETLMARSEVITVGIDGGGLDDLFGLYVLGRCKETKDWLGWGHAWAHDDVLNRRKDIVSSLYDFQKEGSLTICERPTQDIEEVTAYIERIDRADLLAEKWAIGLDPIGIAALIDALSAIGIDGDRLAAVGQGFRLHGDILGIERKLKDGTFHHDGSALMRWSVDNAKTEQRGSAILITKQTAGRAKIDPLIALFNAAHQMSRNPEAKHKPKYQMMII